LVKTLTNGSNFIPPVCAAILGPSSEAALTAWPRTGSPYETMAGKGSKRVCVLEVQSRKWLESGERSSDSSLIPQRAWVQSLLPQP